MINNPTQEKHDNKNDWSYSRFVAVMSIVGTVVGVAAILTYGIVPLMGTVSLLLVTAAVFLLYRYERRGKVRRFAGITLYSVGILIGGVTLTIWALQNFTLQPKGVEQSISSLIGPSASPVLPVLGNHYRLPLMRDTYYDFDAKMASNEGGEDFEIKQSGNYLEYGGDSNTFANTFLKIIPTNTASVQGCEAGTKLYQSHYLDLTSIKTDESVCIKSSKGLWVVLRRVSNQDSIVVLDVQLFAN